ncbi:MAG TPA: hypothetical protein VD838_01765 [Anaeromyxobacteraceae bacterium]|nr:hypothetical protein [Anaeromyxobacteraceae bacterium]
MTAEHVAADAEARVAFYCAIRDVDELGGSLVDRACARWVASAIEGIARGFDDAGDVPGARTLRFAGSDVVRDLASGRWRNDLLGAAAGTLGVALEPAAAPATDPDTEVIERPLSAEGEVIA